MELDERLRRQLEFLVEIDRLKLVTRRAWLMHGDRRENDAEHSWHIAVMAMLLAEYADEPIDASRVMKMALLHDLVEIDAGDTFAFDEAGHADKAERERRAADRIFAILPDDQATDWRAAWDEFEARETPEARFAVAIDRLQPLLHNYYTQGKAWREHGVQPEQVLHRVPSMIDGCQVLGRLAKRLIDDAIAKGYFGRQ